MLMKKSLVLSAMLAALALPLSTLAADEKPADQPAADKPAKPAKAKKKVRHDHATTHKQGAEMAVPEGTTEEKKPLHDHQKMHK